MNHSYLGGYLQLVLWFAHNVIQFDWEFIKSMDSEWRFVKRVREEAFSELVVDMTGCLDSGLV